MPPLVAVAPIKGRVVFSGEPLAPTDAPEAIRLPAVIWAPLEWIAPSAVSATRPAPPSTGPASVTAAPFPLAARVTPVPLADPTVIAPVVATFTTPPAAEAVNEARSPDCVT